MVSPTDPRTAIRAGLSVSAPAAQRPVKGGAMILLAVLLFACVDSMTKHLTMTYNVTTVIGVRYLLSVPLLIAVLYPRHGAALFRVSRKGQVFLRSLAMAGGSFCAASAFQRLPVAETTAIIYLAPFGVLFLSGLVLGEKVRLASWLAAAGGFAGLLLITRPGGGLAPAGVAFALIAAALSVWYYLSSRFLAKTESTIAMLFYVNVAGAIGFGATLPFDLSVARPGAFDVVLLLFITVFGIVSHFLVTAAYREAPAGLLSPLLYLHLVWAGLLGWAVFDHVPDAFAMLGIAVVAISGAGLAIFNYRSERREAAVRRAS